MSRPRGLPKTGGRQRGAANKRTLILQDVLSKLDCNIPERLVQLLPGLEPPKQADVLLELMQFLYPKKRATEVSGPEGQPIQIHERKQNLKILISDPNSFSALEVIEQKLKAKDEQPTT